MSAPAKPVSEQPIQLDAGSVDALAAAIVQKTRPSDALLDAHAGGALLGMTAKWMLAEARASRLPHVRLGRYVRFSREDLLAWATSRVQGPRVTGNRPVSRRSESQ
jgi:predicted DNA-binding transcriptional regulator AlpA